MRQMFACTIFGFANHLALIMGVERKVSQTTHVCFRCMIEFIVKLLHYFIACILIIVMLCFVHNVDEANVDTSSIVNHPSDGFEH